MRGLIYFVVDEDETARGEIAQYRAVIAKAGTISSSTAYRFIASGPNGGPTLSPDGRDWTDITSAAIGGSDSLKGIAVNGDIIIGGSDANYIFRSTDRGLTWAKINGGATWRNPQKCAYGNGTWVITSAGYTYTSVDDGDNWTENAVADSGVQIVFGNGYFVRAGDADIYRSTDGATETLVSGFAAINIGFNGARFMAVGSNSVNYNSPDGGTWTAGASTPISGIGSWGACTGQDGYFLAGTFSDIGANNGIWKTTDYGDTWTKVSSLTGNYHTATSGFGVDIFGSNCGGGTAKVTVSSDGGTTWDREGQGFSSPFVYTCGLTYFNPPDTWYAAPDAPGVYVDEDGNIQAGYLATQTISDADVAVSDILTELCNRVGIEAAELSATGVTNTVRGYPCATESSAQAFIEPLAQACFFDRGEWDKKIRFVPRGGAVSFALTTDDLVARDGPAVVVTKISEVELPLKVTVITIDPAAEYSPKPQSWPRTVSTINAKSEPTSEINIVCDADTGKQIAHKRSNIAWSELLKFDLSLSMKWSKLTVTDVGTFTDSEGVVHRIRINSTSEELGVFNISEAVKDRASCYGSTAVGTVAPTAPTTAAGIIGPTRFVAMNLPQMRAQDNSPGMWVGACGMTSGWTGCKILLSVDSGVSYFTALTITEPTTMGEVTAAFTNGGTPLSVHVFGGTLSSKTTAQVTAGGNYSAVLSGVTAEVLAYETATVGAAGYYDLTVLTQGLKGTIAADHAAADVFMDIASAYYLPIDQTYAGDTLYFKAVGLGVSADAVTAVAYVFDGSSYVYDGGEIT